MEGRTRREKKRDGGGRLGCKRVASEGRIDEMHFREQATFGRIYDSGWYIWYMYTHAWPRLKEAGSAVLNCCARSSRCSTSKRDERSSMTTNVYELCIAIVLSGLYVPSIPNSSFDAEEEAKISRRSRSAGVQKFIVKFVYKIDRHTHSTFFFNILNANMLQILFPTQLS